MAPRIGFIGLGRMGKSMTANIVQKAQFQEPLFLYNRTQATSFGHARVIGRSRPCSSVGELVATSDIIWSCVEDGVAAADICKKALAAGNVQGKIFVECSSLAPEVTDALGDAITAAGGLYCAMPVFGDPGVAAESKIIGLLAGPTSAVDTLQPYLLGITVGRVINLRGEKPSKASLMKTIGSVLIMETIEMISELLVFAEKTGFDLNHIRDLLSALYPGGPRQHLVYFDSMVQGEYYRETTTVGCNAAIKLADRVLGLAEAHEVPLDAYKVATRRLKAARDTTGGKTSVLGIYGDVREASKLPFEAEIKPPTSDACSSCNGSGHISAQ